MDFCEKDDFGDKENLQPLSVGSIVCVCGGGVLAPQAQVSSHTEHSRVACGFIVQLSSFPLTLDSGVL